MFAAARRVRAYLPALVGQEEHPVIDAMISGLLNGHAGPDVEARLRAVFSQDPVLEMFLDAVLADEPRFRPPQVVDQLARTAGFSLLAGDHVPPATDRYCCPGGDFEWFCPGVGTPIPKCPTHGPLGPC